MKKLSFPYIEKEHYLFGKITRPLVRLAFFSERFGKWLEVGQVLADTGADISVIPLPLGQILVSDVEKGIPMLVGGILSSEMSVNAYVHRIKAQIGVHSFEMPIAVSLSSVIPPIWGRREALDRFTVSFVRGQELVLEINEL
ncbi:MAG: hypothetical protein DRR00_02590 [Candidatus Parabeggiatoa sp. nov. 3]|nr:MAG: hypothetical protein DRR00_02590 [Gammaproteobacteria bacterium]RKZ67829.1 MAG: hypothetical protein DRQ99_05595 [Gammaproteobacteria bacterium]